MGLFKNLRYPQDPHTYNSGDVTPKGYVVMFGSIFVFFLLLITLFSSFTTIGVGEAAVVTRFGTVNRELDSGIHAKLPLGFEQVHRFNVKTVKDEVKASASSQEQQDVQATVVTNYHVQRGLVGKLYREVGDQYKDVLIDNAVQNAIKQNTTKIPGAEMTGRRAELSTGTLKMLNDDPSLAARGIVFESVNYTDFQFSAAFNQAIEQKQVAQQAAQQAQFLKQKAENEAAAKVATAQGDSQAQALRQSTLTPELLQQAAIEKWNGALPTTSVSSDSGNFFNIPVK